MKPESKLWHLMKENMPYIFWTRFENWVSSVLGGTKSNYK